MVSIVRVPDSDQTTSGGEATEGMDGATTTTGGHMEQSSSRVPRSGVEEEEEVEGGTEGDVTTTLTANEGGAEETTAATLNSHDVTEQVGTFPKINRHQPDFLLNSKKSSRKKLYRYGFDHRFCNSSLTS